MSVLVTLAVGFVLSPFFVHRLGDSVYGVWVLINSAVAYMALLDFGLRGAIAQFIAKAHAAGHDEEAGQALSGALLIRLGVCGLILLITAALALVITRVFNIPPALSSQAIAVTLLTGTNLAISLAAGVFGGVLFALNRFDLLAAISILQTAASAGGAVAILRSGGGIVPLAVLQLAVGVAAAAVQIVLCFRTYPGLKLRWRLPTTGVLSKLWHYSFYNFVIAMSSQFIYYADNLVVGAFISAKAVTLYAIGGRLIEYHRQFASALAQTMMPLASAYDAQGRQDRLRQLLVQGTRLSLLVGWPIEIALLVRGGTFIRLWMGDQYAAPSATILRILLVSNLLIAGNHVAANVVFGMGKQKRFAIWQSCEAVANLGLSIWLVQQIGLNGVAWGTTIPGLVTQGVLWPKYICDLLGMKILEFVWQAWVRVALAMTPFLVGCIYSEVFWRADHLVMFFIQLAIILPLVPVGALIVFRRDVVGQLRDRDSLFYRLAPHWMARTIQAYR